ncbi:LysM peptidoglycan-binding domain-containing protein [Alicyclobacillus kakegawensis]|uniref:LysM peptidoglycan-binding domain-containing protein n=1 Tax=Alicyclobacillus kakegawensis TaxID=392012 RepID=UPI00082EEE46|nr:LysM peptidoglycan-binding domain-containing protein [Alicyclobacillus kakegawensis]
MKKYVVREGDTMWKISKRTGVRLPLLTAANPQIRDPNQLQPGSIILIPELNKGQAGGGPGQPGTGAAVPAAAEAADWTAAGPGTVQTPASGEPVPPYFGFVWSHVVQPGETWQSISQAYQVPVTQLQQMNTLHKPTLEPGDIVYVPGTGPSPGVAQPGAGKVAAGPAAAGGGAAGWQPAGQGAAAGAGPVPPDWEGPAPPIAPPGYPAVPEPGTGYPGQPTQPYYGYAYPGAMYPPGAPWGYPYPMPQPPGWMQDQGPHTHYPYRWSANPPYWGGPPHNAAYAGAWADDWDDEDSSSWTWDSESALWEDPDSRPPSERPEGDAASDRP